LSTFLLQFSLISQISIIYLIKKEKFKINYLHCLTLYLPLLYWQRFENLNKEETNNLKGGSLK